MCREEVQVYAGAYQESASRLLHPQASCDRGELPVDGQHTSFTAASTTPFRHPAAKVYVLPSPTRAAYTETIPADASDQDFYGADVSAPETPGNLDSSLPAAANAAVALAQLHNLGSEWDSDYVCV